MKSPDYAIGQAVFIRSDTPDYEEETIPFKTLGDLVKLCSEPRHNMVLVEAPLHNQVYLDDIRRVRKRQVDNHDQMIL